MIELLHLLYLNYNNIYSYFNILVYEILSEPICLFPFVLTSMCSVFKFSFKMNYNGC